MPFHTASAQTATAALSEPELLRAAKTGDVGALREIMQRNNTRLYRVARTVLRNDSEAEDVLQETYFKAFQHLPEFRGDAKISTWLTRIALNEALARLRRSPAPVGSPVEPPAREAEVIPFPNGSGDDPERAAARREIAGLLERAIDALPEPFRVVFVLRAVEEVSVEEAAQQLAIPEATVKTRLHRAKRMLRKSLDAEMGAALHDAFPFAGRRCLRITEAVLSRLGTNPSLNAQS